MDRDALQQLVAAFGKYYSVPKAAPLHLSTFGQHNRELLSKLKTTFGSLKAAVRAAREEHIRFIDTTAGLEAVAPVSVAAELQLQFKEEIASEHWAANDFGRSPMSVRIALCLRKELSVLEATSVVVNQEIHLITVGVLSGVATA